MQSLNKQVRLRIARVDLERSNHRKRVKQASKRSTRVYIKATPNTHALITDDEFGNNLHCTMNSEIICTVQSERNSIYNDGF
jgi:hypothetical protein